MATELGLAVVVVLAIIVLAMIVMLMTPVRVELEANLEPDAAPIVRLHLRWARWEWCNDAPRRARRERAVPPRAGGRARAWLAAIRSPGFLRRCGRLIVELRGALRPHTTFVRLRVGFDDPAATGMLAGAIALSRALRPVRAQDSGAVDVEVITDFAEPVLAGRARVDWVLMPAMVAWPAARFLLAPVVWRAVRAARLAR